MAKTKDKKEVGKTIFERALAKLPAEKQEAFKAFLAEDAVLDEIGEHALLRDDYSRLADEATAKAQQAEGVYNANLTWREQKAVEIAEGEKARTTLERMKAAGLQLGEDEGQGQAGAGGTGGTTTTTTSAGTPAGGLTKAEVESLLRGTETQGLAVMTTLTNIGMSHFKEFGEVIDTNTIVEAARKKGVDLPTAYSSLVAERREETRQKDLAKQLADAEKRGFDKARAANADRPYPLDSDPTAAPTTLSGLTKDQARRNDFGVDAAVRAFNASRRGVAS